ncbi:hypothetical protein [Pendulispora albinea]|uniref:Uncharacterized protein n=1 Tax=Pendulispora albinea TaxID=2741071 RepID=A0ABZ2LP78_9BACT
MTTAADLSRRTPRPPRERRLPTSRDARPLPPPEPMASSRWLLGIIAFQFVAQLLLLTSLGMHRSIIRSVALAASLVCLVIVPARAVERHPAKPLVIFILALAGLEIFHPETAGIPGGAAHAFVYLATLAPVFWVSRLKIDPDDFRRIVTLFWVFCTASAFVGMLQVYFPGKFEVDSHALEHNDLAEELKITLASGARIFRPMGLTDAAGGAATAGFYSCVIGTGLLLDKSKWWWRALVFGGMLIGIFIIYLSYVRVLLVMSIICFFGNAIMLSMRGKVGKSLLFGMLIVGIFLAAWFFAVDVGGDNVRARVGSLTASSMNEVYYSNRGRFLEHTFDVLLPKYPLGAGLARWGMMANYFGDFSHSSPIYAELQWTAWLLDGGVPMLLAYPLAMLLCMWIAAKAAFYRLGAGWSDLAIWGGVMFGYDLGILAFTFDGLPFLATAGLEFWMLNAMFFVLAMRIERNAPTVNSPGPA